MVKYPTHLIDVKRAIRWVRSNISTYGGDSSFIAISGATAGAHLALMAAMTPNDAQYQPGFEDCDTSIQACIAINSIYDMTNYKNHFGYNYRKWFEANISGPQEDQFFKECSPTLRLKEIETAITTGHSKKGAYIPPLMIIQYVYYQD